jgi:hypothetical protein
MEDPLLYDRELEDIIDFFNEKKEKEKEDTTAFPDFLEYDGPLLKKGKQGLVGFLMDKNAGKRYVYKISQYLDFMIDQEYRVLMDLNTLRDYCPHFVKMFGKITVPVAANFKRAKNPFVSNPDYKTISTDMLVMQHLEGCKKFFKYIKNDVCSTIELLSIVKQALLASAIAHQKVKFTHYDMHSDNILIQECDPNSAFLYIVNGEYHLVPTYGRCPVIIDFGFSFSKSAENHRMNCSLAHTKYGFIQCKEDAYTDAKLFLLSVSNEINKYKRSDTSQTFRNVVKSLYKDARVDLDCGWDNRQKSNISDDFMSDYERSFERSRFFDDQGDFIVDLLQTLAVLPLTYKHSKEKTKDLMALLIAEFVKIEKLVNDDFYNMYILKEIVASACKNRELYTSGYTRMEAVDNFKRETLAAVDRVAKFCNPKLNWERLLCTLLCLGKNIQNYCHDKVSRLSQTKEKDYKTIPLGSTFEIYKAIEANLPSEFVFDKHTVIYTWNADKENSSKTTLDQTLVYVLNETHPAERGEVYKEYMEHPERFETIKIKSRASSSKGSSKAGSRTSSKVASKVASSREASSKATSKEASSKASSIGSSPS